MRIVGLACLIIVGFPSGFRPDVVPTRVRLDSSFGPWDTASSAIVGVRLESSQTVTIESESYTAHLGTVLAVFKKDPRLPATGGRVTMFEAPCQFCTDHGKLPPWDADGPIRMDTTALLLTQLDQAYDRRSWHGTNLRGSLRGLSVTQAAWRPGPRRHNIWEIAVHAAYWKYAVWRRLTGVRRGSFPLTGSNWFERSGDGGAAAWQADLRLLQEKHRALRDAVADLTPAALLETPVGSAVSTLSLVSGIIAHDLYHAGQIQLIKRLQRR